MSWMRARGFVWALLASVLAVQAEAATWVVSGSGAADFPDLQTAVNSATAGDTIIVLPGFYGGAISVPAGKPLTLIGSGADNTTIQSIRTSGGPLTGVVLRGFRITPWVSSNPPPLGTAFAALDLENGANQILIEDCVLGSSGAGGLNPVPAVRLKGPVDAAFSNCDLFGANGRIWSSSTPFIYHDASPAVALEEMAAGSVIRFHDCRLFGGQGADTSPLFTPGGSGGPGLTASGDGRIDGFGCDFVGGNTGPGFALGSGSDGTGVPGSGVAIADVQFRHQGCEFTSGVDAAGSSPVPPEIELTGGATEVPVGGTPAVLDISGKTQAGQIASLTVVGAPGSSMVMLLGRPLPLLDVPGVLGYYGLRPPMISAPFGVLPPSGQLSVSPLVPPLPAGLKSFTVGVQVAVIPPAGLPALTNVSVATVVVPGL